MAKKPVFLPDFCSWTVATCRRQKAESSIEWSDLLLENTMIHQDRLGTKTRRPKTAETSATRVSSKIAKTVSRHADVQISGRFGSNPAVFIPQRGETGRPIPIQMLRLPHRCDIEHIRQRAAALPPTLQPGLWSASAAAAAGGRCILRRDQRIRLVLHLDLCERNASFSAFSSVCPEPVLAKGSFHV